MGLRPKLTGLCLRKAWPTAVSDADDTVTEHSSKSQGVSQLGGVCIRKAVVWCRRWGGFETTTKILVHYDRLMLPASEAPIPTLRSEAVNSQAAGVSLRMVIETRGRRGCCDPFQALYSWASMP